MPFTMSRAAYADMFGPTTGDRVRLADTDLMIEIERDFTLYGEEVKFGGGKVIRDGMGQSQASRADGAADTVITNAVIIDHSGIIKADIGITGGRISGIGKAGNPDMMAGVSPGMVVGVTTEAIAGEGLIVTAGGIGLMLRTGAGSPEDRPARAGADGVGLRCVPDKGRFRAPYRAVGWGSRPGGPGGARQAAC